MTGRQQWAGHYPGRLLRTWLPVLWMLAAQCAFSQPADGVATVTPADAPMPPAGRIAPPADSRARVAIKQVLASPEFTPQEKVTIPKFRGRDEPEKTSDWLKKVESFFRWISGVLRAGVWVMGGIGVLVLLVTLRYWWRIAAKGRQIAAVNVPTHVGGLDIRRESLPDDISGAARARCLAGDTTGCLSMLYRGALSMLVAHFDCRILSSSTEDECVRRARLKVSAATHAYFAGLTQVWQLSVYAGREATQEALLKLCADFDGHFAAQPATAGVLAIAAEGAR